MLTLSNAKIFNGSELLPGTCSVTLDGNLISAVSEQVPTDAGEVMDIGGMTLMPGLITSHLHADFYKFTLAQGLSGEPLGKEFPPGVMMAIGVRTCRVLLQSGFTGYVGASCSNNIDVQLKMAIAEDIVPGPRIRACGHHIGTTGDLNDTSQWWRHQKTSGTDIFGDGPDELRKLVREETRRGVETIKIFASAGHGYYGRTIRNMDRKEIAAIVEAAHARGARVRAHVCDKAMIMECIELGVDIIDHGNEVDAECIEAMVSRGTFWVPSLIFAKLNLQLGWGDDKMQTQYDSVRRMLPIAHQAGVRILIGDDYSGVFRDLVEDDPLDHQVGCYGREFAYYGALEGLSPEDVLSWGTRNAGELLVDSPARVGVIESGALADLIVVDGNPLEDLSLLERPEQALRAVVCDGALVIDRLGNDRASSVGGL